MSAPRWKWSWARRAVALGFLGLLWFGGHGGATWLRGSTSATRVLDRVPFTDPLAALEVTLASGAWLPELWLGAALLLVLALLIGPVFCGWLCPLGLILDLAGALRRRLERGGKRKLPSLALPRGTRSVALAAVLAFTLTSSIPIFQAISPIHLVARGVVFAADAALWTVLVLIVLELFAPRIWCRSLCALGEVYSLVGRRAPLRIRVARSRAGQIRCRRCDASCPMGIAVMEDYALSGAASVDHPDCTRCGSCVDACPRGVLSLQFRSEGTGSSTPLGGCDHAECPAAAIDQLRQPSEPAASRPRPGSRSRSPARSG